MLKHIPVFLALTLLATSLHGQTTGFAAFDTRLQELMKEHRLPGLAAGIVKDGRLAWAKGYGFADQDREIAVTPDTPFWIASVTKTFIGLLFLQLEADSKVNLNDRINDVPEWDDFCSWLSTSGIVFGKDLRCNAPITIDRILHHTSNGEPGTKFVYNPILYSRLSRYIEHKFGHSVREVEGRQNTMAKLVEDRILAPAGMRRTLSSQWQREKCDVFFDMAQGMELDKDGYVKVHLRPERELAGGAGIVSTVEDLAKYDIALDTGKLASEAVMKKLFTPAKRRGRLLGPLSEGTGAPDHPDPARQRHGHMVGQPARQGPGRGISVRSGLPR
jgi:CubicO group peptidase (beta-lactamase class C family)